MKLFFAPAVSLALLALGNGASLAQSSPPPPSVIGPTSPLGSHFGAAGNYVQSPASQNSLLPYSTVATPCSAANSATSALPTFDGGGFTLSVGTNVNFPTVQVTAQLPGADPQTMAASVATPLEQQFSQIPGLTQLTSSSALGYTQLSVQFNLSRDVNSAAEDVLAAINAASPYLPLNMPYPRPSAK
jgi:hypothetical protein